MNLIRLSVLFLAWATSDQASAAPERPAPLMLDPRCASKPYGSPCALCKNVSVRASTCPTVESIDDGSYDTDSQVPLRCIQTPGEFGAAAEPIQARWSCWDDAGGYDYCTAYVTVIDDSAPQIALEGDAAVYLECGLSQYVEPSPGARAVSQCGTDLSSYLRRTGEEPDTTRPGNYRITYSVRLSETRYAEATRRITVQDTVPPVVDCEPPQDLQAGSDGTAEVPDFEVTARDSCSPTSPIVSLIEKPARLPVGTHSLKYTASDAAGNKSECTKQVTVLRANDGPSGPPPPDRAMLGGGCGAGPGARTSIPFVVMVLAVLWIRLGARRHSRVACWLLLGGVLLSTPASAQPEGLPSFDLERLKLNPSGMGSWVVGTGELLPAGGYRLALLGHYENKPLILYQDGTPLGVVVRHRVTTVLAAAVGLWDRVELGAQLPLLLMQQGDDLADRGVRTPQGGLAAGTPLLTVRLRLLAEHHKDPVDLAVGVNAGPEVGSASALAREVNATPSVMVGRRFGPVRAALDAGVLFRPPTILTNDAIIQDELGHALRFGAGLASAAEGFGGEVAAIGSVPLYREGYSLELLGGLRLPLGKLLEAHALAGLGMGTAPGTPQFRVLLGMSFGKASRSAEPEAPPEPLDPGDRDADGDGVLNRADVCPDEPGLVSNRGCPIKDTDGDGIVDDMDRCPEQKGIVEMRGCPPKDTDGDTVSDHLDNCRKIPGPPTNQGCPTTMRQLVVIQRNRIKIDGTIYFDYDKDTIQPKSYPLLNQVAYVLVEHPEIVSVSIEGHTDSDGSNAYNIDLSRRRAGAVRDYLQRQGVERERMTTQGFGEERPLESNDTDAGRAINRRVEFITRYQ